VDEYQDTNHVQYLIVRQLAEPQNRICVVGDDAQSIYSFRGADIRNILSFQQGYTNAKLFKLERNYRSTQTIVRAANSLIKHNENQIFKEAYSENEEGSRLRLTGYLSDREEAQGVVQGISVYLRYPLTGGQKITADDVAVLYRTNAQSRALENELRHHNIPYRIYGGTSFYQRKEIKDAVAYFRLTANSYDNEALQRVINYPARGIGETTVKRLSLCAIENKVSMFEVAADPDRYQLAVSPATKRKIQNFADTIRRFQEAIDTTDAYFFADKVMRESGIMTAAALDTTAEGMDRKQNLDELLSGIHEFVDKRMQEGISFTPIQDFLGEISLLTDQDENLQDHTPRVTLLTVHAAKGLEFAVVYIVGLEENLFPSQFCKSSAEIEEERRLLYVAITRAMQVCNLTYARQRFKNGSINFSSPSRFLNDIDRNCLQLQEAAAPQPSYNRYTPPMQGYSRPAYTAQPVATPATPADRFRPVTPAAKPSGTTATFAAGERVRHRVFGDGTVQRIYNENDNDKIDILFDKQGKKTLLLTYAKLEKI
jgi:DNA helicase-2/ATP-dependent DNA helicase PcrA